MTLISCNGNNGNEKNNKKVEKPKIIREYISFLCKSLFKTDKNLTISQDGTWTNEACQIIHNIPCKLPFYILDVMRSAEHHMSISGMEFGIYLKGDFKDGILEVKKDFMVPKQTVTPIHIDFEEDDGDKFNGVIHRHPAGVKGFSGTDDKYINQNYLFSLLYVDNEIKVGIINVELKNGLGRVQLPLDIIIDYPEKKFLNKFENKVVHEKTTYVPKVNYQYKHQTAGLPGILNEEILNEHSDLFGNNHHMGDLVNHSLSESEMKELEEYQDHLWEQPQFNDI